MRRSFLRDRLTSAKNPNSRRNAPPHRLCGGASFMRRTASRTEGHAMHLDLYLGFVIASTILILIPGPNVSLIVANSIAHGTRYGLLTVAGTSSAIALQLALTALGLTATLGLLASWFEWIRWIGVGYLIYLGVRQWTAVSVDLTRTRP